MRRLCALQLAAHDPKSLGERGARHLTHTHPFPCSNGQPFNLLPLALVNVDGEPRFPRVLE